MSGRDDGFRSADLDTAFLDDPKVRALVRLGLPEGTVARCVVVYLAVLTSSWAHGERVTVDEAAPLWVSDLAELAGHLEAVRLIDHDGRIPQHAWDGWFTPAWTRLSETRERWRRAKQQARQRRGRPDADEPSDPYPSAESPRGLQAESRGPSLPTSPSSPSGPTDSPEEDEYGEEWSPFLAAWGERFRYAPSGSQDQPKTQRALLWPAVRDYPTLSARWCREAPKGANAYEVAGHVNRAWRLKLKEAA